MNLVPAKHYVAKSALADEDGDKKIVYGMYAKHKKTKLPEETKVWVERVFSACPMYVTPNVFFLQELKKKLRMAKRARLDPDQHTDTVELQTKAALKEKARLEAEDAEDEENDNSDDDDGKDGDDSNDEDEDEDEDDDKGQTVSASSVNNVLTVSFCRP